MPKVKITKTPLRTVKIKSGPKAENGASIETIGNNPFGDTMLFKGPSHSEGGIPIQYGNAQAEVEGNEPAFIDSENSLQIFGKLKVPTMNKTFKTVAKEIAKDEEKTSKLLNKSMELINTSDPYNRYQQLSFNSGMVMGEYAQNKQLELAAEKEQLAALQNAMLQSMSPSEQAKWGKKIKYADGGSLGDPVKKSLAQRHNNPGNIKFAKWLEKFGATKGEAAKDGGNFAQFPSLEAGQSAMIDLLNRPMYRNKKVKDAIKTWTGGDSYKNIPSDLADQVVGKLDKSSFRRVLDTITVGEDSKKYNWEGVEATPVNGPQGYTLPTVEVTAPRLNTANPSSPTPFVNTRVPSTNRTGNYPTRPLGDIGIPNKKRLPSLADQNKLSLGQIAPELLTLATERRQAVPGLNYTPTLYTPYQVSFQDQLNQNQATFSAVARQAGNNPSALGTLAAQKYNADSEVLANQFRTNQGISNDITNKNVSLLNQAELQNLQFDDQQMVRQAQADANTRANVRGAVASISAKYLQNRAENNTIRLYENMFNYRPDNNLNMEYMGPDAAFTVGGVPINNSNQASRTTYDRNGNPIRTTVTTPSQLKTNQDILNYNQNQRRSARNPFGS